MRTRRMKADQSSVLRAFIDLANEREGLLLLAEKFASAIGDGSESITYQNRLRYLERRLERINEIMKMVVGDSELTDCPESPRKEKEELKKQK